MRHRQWIVGFCALTLWACAEGESASGQRYEEGWRGGNEQPILTDGGEAGRDASHVPPVKDAEPAPDAEPTARCEASPCEVGARRCSAQGLPELCAEVAGCAEWQAEPACAVGQACTDGHCVGTCQSYCEVGETLCVADGLRTCVQSDSGCWIFGPPVACPQDQRCEGQACVPLDASCEDECETSGASLCANGGVRYCGQYDIDDCLDLSDLVPCADFETCEAGACVPTCEDQCAVGERRCGAQGPEICGNFNADPCLEFGPSAPCAARERCDDGLCVPEAITCEDNCVLDSLRCGLNGPQHCGDYDDDPCTEWGPSIPCGRGTVCQDGACVAECPAPCIEGERRCVSGGATVCAPRADGCLVFGPVQTCGPQESCSNGVCQQTCADECPLQGQTQCTPEGLRRCGQYDADPCLEWSSPTPCGPLEGCQAGACVQLCEHECQLGERRCVPGGYETCGNFDDDPCLEFGAEVACVGGRVCEAGVCVSPPVPQGLLINELYYDEPHDDGPNVFIEIYGPAGFDLTGVRLIGVNGANGQDYQPIELTGRIPANGLYVVAHTSAAEPLRSLAHQLSGNADYQNGPDTVQLRFGDEVLDALAYAKAGTSGFKETEIAAGFGTPAPGTPAGKSLSRDAQHSDTGDNAADFQVVDPTPGQP